MTFVPYPLYPKDSPAAERNKELRPKHQSRYRATAIGITRLQRIQNKISSLSADYANIRSNMQDKFIKLFKSAKN